MVTFNGLTVQRSNGVANRVDLDFQIDSTNLFREEVVTSFSVEGLLFIFPTIVRQRSIDDVIINTEITVLAKEPKLSSATLRNIQNP